MIPFNEENKAKMREVAETLQGTCKSLDDVLQKVFDDESIGVIDFDIELLRYLDDTVMECQGCNWWCETGEMNDDQLCGDCGGDTNEE